RRRAGPVWTGLTCLDSVSRNPLVQADPHRTRRFAAESVAKVACRWHNGPMVELKNFINGEYVAARGDTGFDLIDPATEASYGSSPVSGAADVDAAFTAAATAFETWGDTTPGERQLALFRIADAM